MEGLSRSYAGAVNAGDSAAYSRLFAPDAIRMPPGLEVRSTPGDVLQLSEDSIYAIAHIEGTATTHSDGARSTFRAVGDLTSRGW